MRTDRRGFTMIELLVVITIIAVLAGMILSVVNMLRENAKSTQTQSAMHQVRMGLEAAAASRGSLPVAVEHPLAGSAGSAAAPRLAFDRSQEALDEISALGGGSTSIDDSSLAIIGVDFAELDPSLYPRLMRADDLFTDVRVPELVGLRRDEATILGVPLQGITRYRRLSKLPSDVIAHIKAGMADPTKPALIDAAVEATYFPDQSSLIQPPTTPDQVQGVLANIVSPDVLNELVAGGSAGAHDPSMGQALYQDRVWGVGGLAPSPIWEPGLIQAPETGTDWVHYRPQGLALVDAWGNPILYRVEDGMAVFESAGKDGVFRVDPGDNRIIETTIAELRLGTFGGDDRDGSKDNPLVRAGRENR